MLFFSLSVAADCNTFTFLKKCLKWNWNFISLCPQLCCHNSVISIHFFSLDVCGNVSIMWNCSIIVIKYWHLLFILYNDTQTENKCWYTAGALYWELPERRPVSRRKVMSYCPWHCPSPRAVKIPFLYVTSMFIAKIRALHSICYIKHGILM